MNTFKLSKRDTPIIKEGNGYDYSCVLVNMPEDVGQQIIDWGNQNISEEDIYDPEGEEKFGREDKPHVTVLYGLHANDPKQVSDLLSDKGPIKIKLGKTGKFSHDDKEVVFVEIESEDLHKLNKLLCDNVEFTNEHPEYKPHMTIAYVKKGTADKYIDKDVLEGQEITLDTVTFSPADGKKQDMPLQKTAGKTIQVGKVRIKGKSYPVLVDQSVFDSYIAIRTSSEQLYKRIADIRMSKNDRVTALQSMEKKLVAGHTACVRSAVKHLPVEASEDTQYDIRLVISSFVEDMSLPVREASLIKKADLEPAWFDPNGEMYLVPDAIHAVWARDNKPLLKKKYKYNIPEGTPLVPFLLGRGWTRVSYDSVQVHSLKSIPPALPDILLSLGLEGDTLHFDDLNTTTEAVVTDDLQHSINMALGFGHRTRQYASLSKNDKQAGSNYGWAGWLSPDGTAYSGTDHFDHKDFMRSHPDLFKLNPKQVQRSIDDPGMLYNIAYRQGWVRYTWQSSTLYITASTLSSVKSLAEGLIFAFVDTVDVVSIDIHGGRNYETTTRAFKENGWAALSRSTWSSDTKCLSKRDIQSNVYTDKEMEKIYFDHIEYNDSPGGGNVYHDDSWNQDTTQFLKEPENRVDIRKFRIPTDNKQTITFPDTNLEWRFSLPKD